MHTHNDVPVGDMAAKSRNIGMRIRPPRDRPSRGEKWRPGRGPGRQEPQVTLLSGTTPPAAEKWQPCRGTGRQEPKQWRSYRGPWPSRAEKWRPYRGYGRQKQDRTLAILWRIMPSRAEKWRPCRDMAVKSRKGKSYRGSGRQVPKYTPLSVTKPSGGGGGGGRRGGEGAGRARAGRGEGGGLMCICYYTCSYIYIY